MSANNGSTCSVITKKHREANHKVVSELNEKYGENTIPENDQMLRMMLIKYSKIEDNINFDDFLRNEYESTIQRIEQRKLWEAEKKKNDLRKQSPAYRDTNYNRTIERESTLYQSFMDAQTIQDAIDIIKDIFIEGLNFQIKKDKKNYQAFLQDPKKFHPNATKTELNNLISEATRNLNRLSYKSVLNQYQLPHFIDIVERQLESRSHEDFWTKNSPKMSEERKQLLSKSYGKIISNYDIFSSLFAKAMPYISMELELSLNVEYSDLGAELVNVREVNTADDYIDDLGTKDVEETEEGREEGNTKENWQTRVRSRSMIEGLSGQLRRLLGQMPMYEVKADGKKKPQITNFQRKRVHSAEYIYADLINIFANITSADQMIPVLESMKESKPWIEDLILLMENDTTSNKPNSGLFAAQLYYALRNDRIQYRGNAIIKNGTKEISSVFNETEGTSAYITNWRKDISTGNNLMSSDIVHKINTFSNNFKIEIAYDAYGNGIPGVTESFKNNIKTLRALIEYHINVKGLTLKEALNEKLVGNHPETGKPIESSFTFGDFYVQLFRAIGINQPKEVLIDTMLSRITLEDIKLNYSTTIKKTKRENPGRTEEDIIKQISNQLQMITLNKLMGNISSITKNISTSSDLITQKEVYYKYIAKEIRKAEPAVLEDSARANNVTYRSNGVPSYAGTIVKKLLNGKNGDSNPFLDENYKKNPFFYDAQTKTWRNHWLAYLDPQKKQMLEQYPYDLLVWSEYVEHNKKEYKNWDFIDNFKIGFNQFNTGQANQNGEGNAFYRLPVPADAQSAEFYGGPKWVDSDFREVLIPMLSEVVMQELDRIAIVVDRSTQKNIKKIQYYDMLLDKDGKVINPGGSEFKFFPEFNDHIIRGKINNGENFMDVINKANSADRLTLVKQEMALLMDKKFNEYYTQLEREGVFTKNTSFSEDKNPYVNFIGEQPNLKLNIEKFYWNDFFAQSQIIQILTTDLAYYKDLNDFFKRAKEFHSPAKKLNIYAQYNGKDIIKKDPATNKPRNRRNLTFAEFQAPSLTLEDLRQAVNKYCNHLSQVEKDILIESYSKIDTTDGQSLVTLKSYRETQQMSGQWNDEKEIAYNNLKSGEFQMKDLVTLWNTTKAYVYTQVNQTIQVNKEIIDPVTGDISSELVETQIRVPLQYKNSEMIMVTNAIFGEIFKDSHLSSLSQYMEENDIDVAHFETAVKVGKSSSHVINLDTTDGSKSIYDQLTEVIGKNENPDELLKSDYIQEFDYDDYGIQVATPNHSVDADILIGAQIKRISGSDFYKDAIFNVKVNGKDIPMSLNEWRSYFEAIQVSSLSKSAEGLTERLSSPEKIAEVLAREIRENPRYSRDLVFSTLLNKKGEFVVPLNDESQRVRIEALLTSVVNNAIVKQKTAGGSFILASDWVLPNNMKPKVVYKKDKSIDHVECYLPCPDSDLAYKLLKRQRQLNKAEGKEDTFFLDIDLKDENGKYIVPRGYLESVGYRIPTEAKYSMAPLKIKGFLPQQMGSVVILPRDIINMSGCDFDVDKMFIMFKSLTKDKDKKGNMTFSLPDFNYQLGTNKFKAIEQVDDLPKYQKDNILIDLIRSSLTSTSSVDKVLPPGEFNEQKKIARIITILSNGEQKYSFKQVKEMSLKELSKLADEYKPVLNPLDPNTRTLFHLRNMAGASLIGAVNNHNMNHLLCQLLGAELKKNFQFTINGITYKSFCDIQNQELHDPKNPKTGKYISNNIASFRFTANNNATDPIANEINLNINTVDYLMTLLRAGVPISTACLILCQPIIKDALKTKGDSKLPLSYFISKEVKLYVNHRLTAKVNQEYYSNIENSITDEMLATQISNPANEEFDKNNAIIGVFLSKIASIADDVKEFTNNTRMDSKSGLGGPYINDGISLITKSSKMDNKVFSFKFAKVENDKNVFEDTLEKDDIIKSPIPVLQAYYSYGLLLRRELFKNYFPQFSSDYNKMITAIESQLLNNKKLTAKNRELIQQHVIQFKMSKILTDSSNTTIHSSDYFINQFPIDFMEYKKGLKNPTKFPFISMIKIKTERISGKRILYFDNIGRLTTRMIADYQRELNILFTNKEKNTDIKNDYAKNLFLYLTYRGFHFNPSIYSRLSTYYIKSQVNEYPKALKDCFTFNTEEIESFIDQFIRHNLQNSELQFIHKVYINSDSAHYFSTAYRKNRIEIEIETNNSANNSTKRKDFYNQFIKIKPVDNNTPIFYKYIKIQLKGVYYYLCLSEVTEDCTAIYKAITPLGVQHQLYEYTY